MGSERDIWIQKIDTAIEKWRQGDYVLGDYSFIQRCHPNQHLTEESKVAVEKKITIAEKSVAGLVVVTQTCDIVRSCSDRPFLEVVPLVEVGATKLEDIRKGKRPQYAYIAGAAKFNLVADLDRVMTIEKAVVAEWEQVKGCQNDEEKRILGQALARKRVRFAFPNDFVKFVRKLQDRIKDKHSRNSEEGQALRSLREIRVRASPSWGEENDSSKLELTFWFIRDEEQIEFQGQGWDKYLEKWQNLIKEEGRFDKVSSLVITLEDITAKDYVESDRLDLDNLSS